MTTLKCSTFVVEVCFNNAFEINNIYELVPVLPIWGFQFKRKVTLPYFGVPDVVVSISPEANSSGTFPVRGIRNEDSSSEGLPSGSFGNAVPLDFQCLDKNMHVKISSSKIEKSKFHITGTKDIEMAKDVACRVINYLKMTDNAWRPFFQLSLYDKYHFINNFLTMVTNEGKFLYYNDKIVQDRLAHIQQDNPYYFSVYDMMARFTFEFNSIEMLYAKLYRIVGLKIGTYSLFHNQTDFIIESYSINLGVYNANLGAKNLSLSYISNALNSDQELIQDDYQFSYNNSSPNKFIIMAPVKFTEYTPHINNGAKITAYLFHVRKTGGIRLYSKAPTHLAIKEGERIIRKIREIISSQQYMYYTQLDTNCTQILPPIVNNQTVNHQFDQTIQHQETPISNVYDMFDFDVDSNDM